MMKKNYIEPEIMVMTFQYDQHLLAGSTNVYEQDADKELEVLSSDFGDDFDF